MTIGSKNSIVTTNIIPEWFTFSGCAAGMRGYWGSPSGRLSSGLKTTVPHRGHFFSLSASSTPHFIQYIYLSFLSARQRSLLSTLT